MTEKTKFRKPPESLRKTPLETTTPLTAKKPVKNFQDSDAFIEAANSTVNSTAHDSFPWDGLNKKRSIPVFNLRLTDYEKARLKFLSDNTEASMHAIVAKATRIYVDEKIKELLEK